MINVKTFPINFKVQDYYKISVRWDESVRKIFHEILKMPEPVYEYEHEEVFPLSRPEGIC